MPFSKRTLASAFVAALSGALLSENPGFPPDTSPADVRVDGVSGSLSLPRTFSQGTAVRIVITNVNPFLFQYRIQTTETTLTEPSPRDFFNFVFDLKLEKPAKATAVTGNLGPTMDITANVAARPTAQCDKTITGNKLAAANQAAADNSDEASRLQDASKRLSATFNTVDSASGQYDRLYRPLAGVLYDAAQPASAVKPAAMEISRLAREFQTTLKQSSTSVATQLGPFTTRVATFNGKVAKAAGDYPECTRFTELLIAGRHLVADTLSFRANERLLASKTTEMKAIADEFSRAPESSLYYITQLLPIYEGPTDVTITILRRPVSAASGTAPQANPADPKNKSGANSDEGFRQVAQVRINVGGRPRFSIGGGIAVAGLAIQDYTATKIATTPSEARPGDTTAIVVVAKEASDYRVVPMITLNTRLWNLADTHVTLGIGMRRVTNDNDLQYLVGLTQGFFGRRIMATAGAFTARKQSLRPGLHVGDRLPSVDGNSLMQSRLTTKFGMALTYRLY